MQIFVKCFIVFHFLSCLVHQINSELCSENSSVNCQEINFQNISESNSFHSGLFPSSIFYRLSVLAIKSTSANNVSNCVQQLIKIVEAVKIKETWALKGKISEDDLTHFQTFDSIDIFLPTLF